MNMTQTIIRSSLDEALDELTRFLADPQTLPAIGQGVEILAEALQSGHKVMSCGNGGSLCDATHFAEELTGRFRKSRRPLPAMSVNDPAYFTCVGNDYSFDVIFQRWVEAFGRPGDVLVAISTSGTSSNVLKAVEAAPWAWHESDSLDFCQREAACRCRRCGHQSPRCSSFRQDSGDTHQGDPHNDRGSGKQNGIVR